jgi:hypothetical protein
VQLGGDWLAGVAPATQRLDLVDSRSDRMNNRLNAHI